MKEKKEDSAKKQEETDGLKGLREELSKKTAEAEEARENILRLHAEFDNFKKRISREKQEFVKFANDSLILELLYIFDNFERALQAADQTKDFKVLHQGVEMILKQMQGFLKEKGLERIQSLGEKFDPDKHEALEQVQREDAEDDTIAEECQPGYTLDGRVIRPARVKVVKKKQQEEEQKEENNENKEEPQDG